MLTLDQVLWFVCSDADPTTTADLYGTEPMNIEMQMTLWGYNQPGAGLGQIVFKQTRIINRSSEDITDAYISQWSDPDLGDYGNDLVGVDTSLSLMYAYNGEVEDAQYAAFGLAPAAIGYDYFAGPKIPGEPTDTAIFNLQKLPDIKTCLQLVLVTSALVVHIVTQDPMVTLKLQENTIT